MGKNSWEGVGGQNGGGVGRLRTLLSKKKGKESGEGGHCTTGEMSD